MSTETELSSVNSILGAIGQSPVTRVYNDNNGTLDYINPELAVIHNILMEVNKDVQNEGWIWNTEFNYPLKPDVDGIIIIPPNVLRMDVSEGQVYRNTDVVRQDGKLYDRLHHTYKFDVDKSINFDVTWLRSYEDLPSAFQRYIVLRASGRAATQLVANPQLVQLLGSQEVQARAACMEYECNQGDHTFFGTPPGTAYRAYQPYRVLAR